MATATFSVTVQCKECGASTTMSDTDEVVKSVRRGKHFQCKCGRIFPFRFTSIALKHTADVGAFSKITHTITNGSISSTVS